MTDRTQEAKRLLGEIRYQVFRPEVTTVGDCERGCGNRARRSMVCVTCLVKELRELLPEAGQWPIRYWQVCVEHAAIERRIVCIAEGVDDGR